MTIIREHALERFWLERRLSLLDHLDRLADDTFYADNEDDVIDANDKKIKMIQNHYRDVIDPANLADTIKKIYPPKQYGKVIKE